MVSPIKKTQILNDLLDGKTSNVSNKVLNLIIRENVLSLLMVEKPGKEILLKEKYLNNNSIKQELVRIHEEILSDTNLRQTFGPGTFQGLQGKLNCIILTKRVIEEKLNWSLFDVVQKINYRVLYKYKLRCTKSCFTHLYQLIMNCYPDAELKPYYFKKASNIWLNKAGDLNKELITEAMREFISVLTNSKGKYKYKLKEMPRWVNYKLFRLPILPYETNLSYLLSSCFGNSHIKAIMFTYPEMKLKPYYFSNVPNKYWSGDKGKVHAKELMTELMTILTNPKGKYKLSNDEVKDIFKFKTYGKPLLPYKKNLRGMLQTVFKNSPSAPFKLLMEDTDDK